MSLYDGSAVTVRLGDGTWRNRCPAGCGYEGAVHLTRSDAIAAFDAEAASHACDAPAGEYAPLVLA